jgi:predicted alpha-1,2-mannosidase
VNRSFLPALGLVASIASAVFSAPAPAPADYVDPTIGGVSWALQPVYPNVHQPNQMLRTFPQKEDYLSDQIQSLPLQILHHRGIGMLPMRFSVGAVEAASWRRPMNFDHDLQTITPWHYKNFLIDDDITIELAPGKKAAIYRLDFPAAAQKNILIAGTAQMSATVPAPHAFLIRETFRYVSKNNTARPPSDLPLWCYGEVTDLAGRAVSDLRITAEPGQLAIVAGPNASANLTLKYALSYVSAEQAKENFQLEVAGKDLPTLSAEARLAWDRDLSRIRVKGGTEAQRRSFYSALYRNHERMIDIAENGKYYSGYDETVHVTDRPHYVDDGAWDTYRSHHPLRTLLNPAQEADMLHSLAEMSRQAGNWMPTYARPWGNHPCMVGYHSSVMFLDAHRKGLTGFDLETAYRGIHQNLTKGSWIPWRQGAPRTALDGLTEELGYFPSLHPGEKETEPLVDAFERRQPVAVTLSRAFDLWALSQLALDLGKREDNVRFAAAGADYKTLWHPQHRLFMPKDAAGNWVNIDPKRDGGRGYRDYFDENNGWTYAWLVQHDVPGLMALLGGPAATVERLDQLFREPLGLQKSAFLANGPDSTGMVGQFSMGNELSFHIPFLYNYAGAPWKTQQRTRFLLDVWFKDNLFGSAGDEDGGAMGSWVVLASMGLYQVTPRIPVFTITSPVFTEIAIDLPGARVFKISAPAASKRRKYIQAAFLNGAPLDGPFITYRQIMAGGELTLELGEKPNRAWGAGGFPSHYEQLHPQR